MSYTHVPEELKKLPQWVAFRIVDRGNGNKGKIPVNPKTGENAKANDPTTWGTFDQAIIAVDLYELDGVGFEFANGIFGVDLDHVIDGSGNITPEAKDVVETLDSYTELSPSGTGLHILCKGTVPPGDRRNGFIEMYGETRFFTVTGKPYGSVKALSERSEEAAAIHKKYIYRERSETSGAYTGEAASVDLTDQELLEKAFASSRGSEIRKLWEGDTSTHNGDHSAADLALVRDLAYWTNGDAGRIDKLFRSSGLMRDKWDRKTGGSTYGANTINFVLKDFTPYTVQTPLRRITSHGKEIYNADKPREEAAPMSPQKREVITAADFLKSKFKGEREAFNSQKMRKTGFSNIDEKSGGLYSGLYVIGAQSSLGKTTLMLQIADQLAEQGEKVLYFSLEQSAFELTSKSLARESFKCCAVTDWESYDSSKDKRQAMSAIAIRNGTKLTEEVKQGYKNYSKYAGNIFIKEGNFSETIDDIQREIESFIQTQGVKPIVIIDYLQIIQPIERLQTANDKAQTDYTIHALKTLQRNNDLVVFVISSFNRANYMQEVSFESFKETGGIEYTCDVLWGLQYSCISTNPVFDTQTQSKIGDKRRAIKEAKRQIPRKIQLVCLKNRYGRDYDAYFEYNPAYDYFKVDTFTEAQHK